MLFLLFAHEVSCIWYWKCYFKIPSAYDSIFSVPNLLSYWCFSQCFMGSWCSINVCRMASEKKSEFWGCQRPLCEEVIERAMFWYSPTNSFLIQQKKKKVELWACFKLKYISLCESLLLLQLIFVLFHTCCIAIPWDRYRAM